MSFNYKNLVPLNQRKEECEKLRENYDDRIPVICEKDPQCLLQDIDKCNFLVPINMIASQFFFLIRKKLNLTNDSALFFITENNRAIMGSDSMLKVYEENKNQEDGYLYIHYSSEVMFG